MKMPPIVFSEWVRWKDRTNIPIINQAGIYILAKFKKAPEGNVDPKDEKIIYIGETCTSLKRRLNSFSKSAFNGKFGHSGGLTYRAKFKDRGNCLFVAAAVPEFPVKYQKLLNPKLLKELRCLFIKYFERKLILEFALKHGSKPKLNKI